MRWVKYFLHLLLVNKSVAIFLNKCKLRQTTISFFRHLKIVDYCISIKRLVLESKIWMLPKNKMRQKRTDKNTIYVLFISLKAIVR